MTRNPTDASLDAAYEDERLASGGARVTARRRQRFAMRGWVQLLRPPYAYPVFHAPSQPVVARPARTRLIYLYVGIMSTDTVVSYSRG
jgi:hypothetical protein